MENVRDFSDLYYELTSEERHRYLMGLAQLKVGGMTYKAIGGLTNLTPSALGQHLKAYEREYRKLISGNQDRLHQSLKRVDPEYDYMVDPRTVHQQMCALLMGGDEIKNTLEQLTGVNK